MSKYANWNEYVYGGRKNRIIKRIIPVKCKILQELNNMVLVEYDQDTVWINKNSITITNDETDKTERRNN